MGHRYLGRLPYVLAASVFAGSLCIPVDSEACPLLDRIFRRRQARRMAFSQPAVGACSTGACGNGAYCEQTVVNYVPQTSYRTVWQPVPVTTYRRTTHCNPATGLPITCTRPCTTYTYQARRVPYTSYRPVYTKVPVSVPTQTVNYMPTVAPGGCNTCSIGGTTGYSSIPNYGAPGYSIPSSRAPQSYSSNGATGATQWERVDPGTSSSGGYRSDDPADNRPTLPRGDEPRIEGTGYTRALQRIPSTSSRTVSRYDSDPYYRGQSSSRYDNDRYDRSQNEQGGYDRERSADSYPQRSANRRQSYRSDDATSRYARIDREYGGRASGRDYGESILRPQSNRANSAQPDARSTELQPVPNESPQRAAPPKDLPPLLNTSRDREASIIRPIATRWASNKIYWNEIARVERQRDRDGDYAVRQASAEQPAPTSKSTIRSIRRDSRRYRGDDHWESNSAASTSKQNRAVRINDAGWSSNR